MHLDLERERLIRLDGLRIAGRDAVRSILAGAPAPVTCVTVPSGATSFRRAYQSISGTSAETRRSAFGMPRISTSCSSGGVS